MNKLKKFLGGLGLVAVLAGGSSSAKGDQIYFQVKNSVSGVNKPVLRIDHTADSFEVYDTHDGDFIPRGDPLKSIDFYSDVEFDPFKLSLDSRPVNSYSNVMSEIYGRNLAGSVSNSLIVMITDDLNEHVFDDKNIFADLYNPAHAWIGTYNIRDVIAGTETFPTLTINNGLSYTMDIRFEPIVTQKPGDTNNDGIVDAVDYIAVKRNMGTSGEGVGLEQGDFDGDGDVDYNDLQTLIAGYGGVGSGGTGSGEIVSAQTYVPEPATVGLLALGGLVAIVSGRKKKR